MNVLEDFKNKIGRWKLAREAKLHKAKRKLIPFDQAQHIGIVYDANIVSAEEVVTQYANRLRAEGKKVFIIGFLNQKELPATRKFVVNAEFFWKEKLTQWNLPDKGKIGQFLQIEFDMLLSIYHEPVLPVQAISVYSKAKYKVGPLVVNGLGYYDFMVDISPRKEASFLIEQMDFYLRNIV